MVARDAADWSSKHITERSLLVAALVVVLTAFAPLRDVDRPKQKAISKWEALS